MKTLRAAVLTLLLTAAAHAATVSGVIESTTWTADQSPYHVVGTVRVAQGAVLSIDPGVDVLFDVDVPFIVEGALMAIGTEADSVRFLPGESTTWQGFCIEAGDCHLYYTRISGAEKRLGAPVFDGRGGAIRAVGPVHVDLHNVVLTGNRAYGGGAIYAGDSAHVQLQDCSVVENYARHSGAGIRVQNRARLEAVNSEFSRNSVDDPSLEINEGGGIMVWGADVVLNQCVIRGNSAGRGGGGGIRAVGGFLELYGCEVSANSIRPTSIIIPFPFEDDPDLPILTGENTGLIIPTGDSAALPKPTADLRFGGGIWLSDNASMTMEQCTVAMNTAEETGGIGVHGSNASISRSIAYMNQGRNLLAYVGGSISVVYSNVPAPSEYYPWPGEGNLNVNPLFVDPDVGDFTLQPESPCWYMGAYPLDEGTTPPEHPILTDVDSDSVSGLLGTMTWTSENSPYRVVGPVRVARGETLTIDPGVDVLFDVDVPFIVEGALMAIGTEADSIRFLPGEAEEWGGLRIIGGESNEIAYARISGGNADGYEIEGYGGGIFLYYPNTRLVLSHSVISDNDAFNSGGMIVGGHSWARISHTTFENNRSHIPPPELRTWGWLGDVGGLCISWTEGTIVEHCRIINNTAELSAGAMALTDQSIVTVRNTLIAGNRTLINQSMGAIWVLNGCRAEFDRVTIVDNVSPNSETAAALLARFDSPVTMTNSIVWGNEPVNIKGKVSATYSDIYDARVYPEPIIWYDDPILGYTDPPYPSEPMAQDTILQLWQGVGNINEDPLFVDRAAGDYRLTALSPCVDAGDPASELDPDGTRADMGAFYFDGGVDPGMPRLELPITQVHEGIVQVPVRITGRGIQSIHFAFLMNESLFTPADPLISYHPLGESDLITVNVVGDTVSVSIDLAVPTDYDSVSIVELSFLVPELPLGIYEVPLVAVGWPITTVSESPIRFVSGVVQFAERPAEDDPTSIEVDAAPRPFALKQNAPNPFNPRTALRFSIPEAGAVRLTIYDINGRLVRTLVDGNREAGTHEVVWDARDDAGRAVASGVYVYRLTSGTNSAVGRMTLIR